MGAIVRAVCRCGFEREMSLGGGMANFTTHCSFPLYCGRCKALFEGNMLRKRIVCPNCKKARDVVPYDDDRICRRKGEPVFGYATEQKLGRRLVLTDGEYLCPQCGRFTLSFTDIGDWD